MDAEGFASVKRHSRSPSRAVSEPRTRASTRLRRALILVILATSLGLSRSLLPRHVRLHTPSWLRSPSCSNARSRVRSHRWPGAQGRANSSWWLRSEADRGDRCLRILLSNVSSFGTLAQSFVYDSKVMNKYQVLVLVESKVRPDKVDDVKARARTHHAVASVYPVQATSEVGSHGGELILCEASLPIEPIDPDVLSAVVDQTGENLRCVGSILRLKDVSCLLIGAYFWVGEN